MFDNLERDVMLKLMLLRIPVGLQAGGAQKTDWIVGIVFLALQEMNLISENVRLDEEMVVMGTVTIEIRWLFTKSVQETSVLTQASPPNLDGSKRSPRRKPFGLQEQDLCKIEL